MRNQSRTNESIINEPILRFSRHLGRSKLTIVNKSDKDCLFDETSCEGAPGSSATTTAPGAPGVFDMLVTTWPPDPSVSAIAAV